jgi:DNA repair protein RadC
MEDISVATDQSNTPPDPLFSATAAPDATPATSGAADFTSRAFASLIAQHQPPFTNASQNPPTEHPQPPAPAKKTPEKPHYHGHRQRLKARFLETMGHGFADYEILELVLFSANARADVKPLAKKLLDRFGSFASVIAASPADLKTVQGCGDAAVVALKICQQSAIRLLKSDVIDQPILGKWDEVMDYCRAVMEREKIEQFRILFLDHKNRLIRDEMQQQGTINHTPVYPREVVKRALELHAAAIIIAHNHPSGDPAPSQPDIGMTQKVKQALAAVDIALHDHVIVGKSTYTSFRSRGLL